MKKRGNRSKADVNPLSDSAVSPQASLAQSGQDLRRKAEAFAREQTAHTPADLRKQAETRLALSPEPLATLSPDETRDMLHELRVHQIELEMQNEELRNAQAEIEAGRARYFDLYDLAPVGYVTVGEKGLVLEANLTAAALLGVNRAALVRQPLTRFILKKDQDLFYLLRKRLAEGAGGQAHSLQTCELRMLKPDGSYFWAQLDATAAEGPDGAPAYRVVLSDITERRERQQHVELLVRMLDEAPAAITVHDTDGRFLFANRRTLELHGYADMESFLAVNLHKLDVPESETRIAERFAAIERDGEASFEVAHHRTDGSTFPLALVARKIEWQGHPAVLSIAADITDRKQADEALREQMEELQRWHKVTLGREARVIELKHEVNGLLARIGEPTRYAAVGAGGNGQA